MEDVEKDSFYFMNSDGGMTLSGGETCLQPEFARALLSNFYQIYIPVVRHLELSDGKPLESC